MASRAIAQQQLINALRAEVVNLELEVGQHQMETSRRVNPVRVRRCGRCRCPGHTRGRCKVFIPSQTHYMDIPDGAATERAQLRLDVIQLREIRARGFVRPITRHEALTTWLERSDTDNSAISDNEMTGARNEERSARQRLDVALRVMHEQDFATPDRRPGNAHGVVPEGVVRAQHTRDASVAHSVARQLFDEPEPAPAPVQATVIQHVPPVVVEKPIEETTCAICLEDLNSCNKFITACGHQFHANCMIKTMVMTQKMSCPACRTSIV